MKKAIFFLAAALLASCGTTSSSSESASSSFTSSSEQSSSEIVSSSSEESSSSSQSSSISEGRKLKNFALALEDLIDHPYKAKVESLTSNYYATDGGGYFQMDIRDDFTIQRYLLDGVDGLTERKGEASINDGMPYGYTTQCFHDRSYFYALTDYKDASDIDMGTAIPYDSTALEANLSINFSYKEADNIRYMVPFLEESNVIVEYDIPEEVSDNGELIYSYSLFSYIDGYPDVKISHEVKATIEQGVVLNSYSKVETDIYLGTRTKVNYSISEYSTTYYQGEYKEFDGTKFKVEDFVFGE